MTNDQLRSLQLQLAAAIVEASDRGCMRSTIDHLNAAHTAVGNVIQRGPSRSPDPSEVHVSPSRQATFDWREGRSATAADYRRIQVPADQRFAGPPVRIEDMGKPHRQ